MSYQVDKQPLTATQRAMKIIGTIFGWLFNIIMIGALVLIMADITGQRKSFADKAPAAPSSVEESSK